MKNIFRNSIAILALLTSSFAFAEDKTFTQDELHVGDSVKIKRTPETRYLTGEEPSEWVYDETFTIQQVGGKRFPEGLLIKDIISWIGAEFLYLPDGSEVPVKQQQQAEQPKAAQQAAAQEEAKRQAARQASQPQQPKQEQQTQVREQQPVQQPIEEVKPAQQEPVKEQEPVQQQEQQPQQEEQPQPQEQPQQQAQEQQPSEQPATAQGEEEKKEDAKTPGWHRFSIGVRGGVASLMHDNAKESGSPILGNWKAGWDALLDLQYAYYWGHKEGQKINYGIITGISVGYASSSISKDLKEQTPDGYTDKAGNSVTYSFSSTNVNENDAQIQIEVPVMFSLLTEGGLFFNVGPKFMMPVFTRYTQHIENADLDLLFNDYGVHVTNEDVIGVVTNDGKNFKGDGTWGANKLKINIMLTAELGYEFKLNNGDALGLGVYGNYAPYNTYSNEKSQLINLEALDPTAGPVNQVTPQSATDAYTEHMNYFDAGVKLVYHFNFPKQKK